MKVLYLALPRTCANRLTSFTFVDEEIAALAARGLEVFVPTYQLPEQPRDGAIPANVHLRTLPPGNVAAEYVGTLRFLWQVRHLIPSSCWWHPATLYYFARIERFASELVQRENIDVIHSQFGWPGGLGGLLTRAATGKPLVATMRGMDVLVDRELSYGLRLGSFYDVSIRMLLENADVTVHVSDFIREKAIALGAPKASARTIRKGVDCDHFRPIERKNACPTILTVGGLVNRKGVDWVLKALAPLIDTNHFSLEIAGDGPERKSLEDLCERLQLESRTTFHGFVPRDEIQDLFAACDIFVLGSILEASGNVLLEALASGRAVICTDSGGPPEYITDGVTGFVVPVADPGAMAEKIKRLLDDRNLREEFGRQGRVHAIERFAYARMIDEISSAYHQGIASRNGTRPS